MEAAGPPRLGIGASAGKNQWPDLSDPAVVRSTLSSYWTVRLMFVVCESAEAPLPELAVTVIV